MNKFGKYSLFLLLFLTLACNKDNDCDGTFTIESVLPNSNPAGSEVKISGTGFSKNSEVRFAGQLAKSSFTNENGLVATVPNNVSGLVDLTVEDGGCLARTDFEVLGTLPVNWVASPTVIVIPTFPATFPDNISNEWVNYYDKNHTITIVQNEDCFGQTEVQLDSFSSSESHATNAFLNGNPISGTYKCSGERLITLVIDRTKKGGTIDTLDGNIIQPETLGEDNNSGKKFMLLTSRGTGRQYVFFFN